jgi:regulator of sirC expression with transglutaminase-like and TPR domain
MSKLRIFESSLDHVRPDLRDCYVRQDNGRFKLDLHDFEDAVEDAVEEQVSKLKSALRRERESNKAIKKLAALFADADGISAVSSVLSVLRRQQERTSDVD